MSDFTTMPVLGHGQVIGHMELREDAVRDWFKKVDIEQAEDTFRVVEGILEMRKEAQPKRKRRSDAGQSRSPLSAAEMKDATRSMLRDMSADRGADD